MKQRMISLLALLCLVLSLAACGSGTSSTSTDASGSQNETATAMTEEEYKSRVQELSEDISAAISSMNGLSTTDEASFQEGIDAVRTMVEPFRSFASISNPPEAWAQAHTKIAEGCTVFADSLDGLCNSAEKMLSGEMTTEDYNSAVTEYTAGLTDAASLLNEGLGMIDA